MNTKILLASLTTAGLATAFGASAAHADGLKVGAQAQILPFGSEFETEGGSLDLRTAFAIAGTFDYAVHPNIDVGAAPRIILGVKPSDEFFDEADAATQYDLATRVTGHAAVAPKIDVFGFVSPAYSILTSSNDDADSATGLSLGFGGGAKYAVTPTLSVVGEVGYQLGFQKVDDADAATNLLHLGVGIQAAL